jgi:transcriptional regulator with XRE-family HTH domain
MTSLPETAPLQLHPLDVGARLRALRVRRRLTLREVSVRAGLSESFLSRLERGHTSVSIASLQRIAAAVGVEVSDLFSTDAGATHRVVRREGRQTIAFGTRARKALLTSKPFHELEVVVAEFDPGGSTGDAPYTHGDSDEVFFVVRGRVHLQLGDELLALEAGDSAHYRSSTPHRVVNAGDEGAEVLFMISPPSF